MELIHLSGVNKKYKNGVTAVYDLNLKIKKGDFVFVIGGSGSGKSTVIKMLYREEKPTSGKIIVGGLNVAKLRNSKVYKLRRKLGIVFQDYRLLKALDLVGLKNKIRNYPNQLSGGEQQRVAIARAIVNNPKLLLCDEPTGNLDPDMSKEIMDVLDNINKTTGTTIVMATHDKDIVNRMKKRVVVLKSGRLVKDYTKGRYDDEAI